ncbi:hypothetical protein OROMI_001406 [Orobanche minor]
MARTAAVPIIAGRLHRRRCCSRPVTCRPFSYWIKWCPAPGCESAAEYVVGSGNYDVTCSCSYSFCWNILVACLPRLKVFIWLIRRQASLPTLENTPVIPQPSADELTAKITRDLESQMEAKVNKKVQENMTWFLKKLGEMNPTLKFDIGDFCATFSSQDETGTPITQIPGGATS